MNKFKIQPGRTESKFTFAVGIVFTLFGVVMILGGLLTPLTMVMVPFGVLWTAVSAFNTYRAYKNGFTKEGMAYYEITSSDTNTTDGIDFDDRLRKLELIKSEGLITQEEYKKKRREIMSEKW